MGQVAKACLDCGVLSTISSRCRRCLAEQFRRESAIRNPVTRRIYGSLWRAIVAQKIIEQPWCSKCFATEDLTGDHIIPVRLGGAGTAENCRILCRRCNSRRQ